jgi:hypothetical protein
MEQTDAVAVVSEGVYANQVKLFGKWNCDEVEVGDISLQVIICELFQYMPHICVFSVSSVIFDNFVFS